VSEAVVSPVPKSPAATEPPVVITQCINGRWMIDGQYGPASIRGAIVRALSIAKHRNTSLVIASNAVADALREAEVLL